jgi:riboflavin kinase/FMN adenylyltransferase
MKVIKHLKQNSDFHIDRSTAIALGTFDGVHLGHQQVINTMIGTARTLDYDALVFTFSNLPKYYQKLRTQENRILSIEDKIELFESLGLDYLWIVPFNEAIKTMTREDFIHYLCTHLNMKHLTIGYNFRFGLDGKGTVEWLKEIHESYGFSCHVIGAIEDTIGPISSTRIRTLLKDGQIESANQLLGRTHYVSGVVHPGKQLGRTIGFPTANLKISPNMTLIKSGVYITETCVDDKRYYSVTNVGYNPTFDQEDFNLETYILDFNEDLYHKRIKVYFHSRIRDELKLNGVEELKEWITKDVQDAKQYFASHEYGKHIYKTLQL